MFDIKIMQFVGAQYKEAGKQGSLERTGDRVTRLGTNMYVLTVYLTCIYVCRVLGMLAMAILRDKCIWLNLQTELCFRSKTIYLFNQPLNPKAKVLFLTECNLVL